MASDRVFNPSLHKRLIEITDEVGELNGQIETYVLQLKDRPELAADIRLLMVRCTTLVREAVELRSSANSNSADGVPADPSRSFANDGPGNQGVIH